MDFSNRRGQLSVVVWVHGRGVKRIQKSEFMAMLEKRGLKTSDSSVSIKIQNAKWSGDQLTIPVSLEDFKTEKSMAASFTLDVTRMSLSLVGVK